MPLSLEALSRPVSELLPGAADRRTGWWWRDACRACNGVAGRDVARASGGRLAWLRGSLALLLVTTLGTLALNAVVLLIGWVWGLATGARGSDGPLGTAASVTTGIPVLVFSLLTALLGAVSWYETGSAAGRAGRGRLARFYEPSHQAFLLPGPARLVWRRRLLELVGTAAVVLGAGLLTEWAAVGAARLLPGGAVEMVGVARWFLGGALAFAGPFFALAPLLRQTARVIHMPLLGHFNWVWRGALVGLLSGFCLFGPSVGGWPPEMKQAVTLATLGAAAAWWVVLLGLSWLWCEPAGWRPRADGSPSSAAAMRAGVVLASLAVSGLVMGAAAAALMATGLP